MLPAREKIAKIIGNFELVGRLSGGDIATIHHLRTQSGDFALKSGERLPQGMFASEAFGLRLMAECNVATPEIIEQNEDFLLMRYLAPGRRDERSAGAMLARLHSRHAEKFGLNRDTYLATLLQNNKHNADWADLYFRQRIFPLLRELAVSDPAQWEKFSERVYPLVAGCGAPALLHGDLWSGNLYYSATGPVFIDPACYFGDPLIDIAMTRLFGGFGDDFYQAYRAVIGKREYEADLLRIYQLYPLLVHARLFGGGYYRSACALRDAFL